MKEYGYLPKTILYPTSYVYFRIITDHQVVCEFVSILKLIIESITKICDSTARNCLLNRQVIIFGLTEN